MIATQDGKKRTPGESERVISAPANLVCGEWFMDGEGNGSTVHIEDSSCSQTSEPLRPLEKMLIEALPRDARAKPLSKRCLSSSSSHSGTSSIDTPPVGEDSDVSMISDGQSSIDCSSSDHDSLLDEACTDDRIASLKSVAGTGKDVANSEPSEGSFMMLRMTYLLVTLVIMLADGLQGTHLYVLYESYGFSVAHLYCLGFATGGLMSPITGPLVDKIGRKKSAILYCVLEIFINMLEQHPFLSGLIVSRMVGGFTTNLLSSVFETWLDTEYRRRGFKKDKYEIIMRDSVIVSNMAAICSGYFAHVLAEKYGAVGPFQGAVSCTAAAFVVVCFVWSENYGSNDEECTKNMMCYFKEAATAFRNDSRMLRVGFLQGLTEGAIQIFVFLWAPTLRHFAVHAPEGSWGLDAEGEPAYGLIFGAYMGAGVLGGLVAPHVRRSVSRVLSPIADEDFPVATIEIDGEGTIAIRPMAVEFLASLCYFLSAILLFVPAICSDVGSASFSVSLSALVLYEFLIGIFLPCEGVIRSLYFPANARASIMTMPRIIVNVAVAIGVVSTTVVSLKTAFFAVGCLMIASTCIQFSLISHREWSSLFSRADRMQGKVRKQVRSLSMTLKGRLSRQSSLDTSVSFRHPAYPSVATADAAHCSPNSKVAAAKTTKVE